MASIAFLAGTQAVTRYAKSLQCDPPLNVWDAIRALYAVPITLSFNEAQLNNYSDMTSVRLWLSTVWTTDYRYVVNSRPIGLRAGLSKLVFSCGEYMANFKPINNVMWSHNIIDQY